MPETCKIRLQPYLVASAPEIGIANIAPAPRHNNKKPKVLSSIPIRVFIIGISEAHVAVAKPAHKNSNLVAKTSRLLNGHIFNDIA